MHKLFCWDWLRIWTLFEHTNYSFNLKLYISLLPKLIKRIMMSISLNWEQLNCQIICFEEKNKQIAQVFVLGMHIHRFLSEKKSLYQCMRNVNEAFENINFAFWKSLYFELIGNLWHDFLHSRCNLCWSSNAIMITFWTVFLIITLIL